MKTLLSLAGAAMLLLVVGCATLDSRISKNQMQFDGWPTEVQQKIRRGQVDVGFTPPQVLVALGEPQKKYTRTTARGVAEVWAYTGGGGGFSIGVGVGSARGSGAYGGGVGYDSTTYRADDERVRVIFADGRVTSVEARSK
ncbi:MAG: hypothetical protein KA257_07020 [Opitutaceae bacterium]|nr:hypothetical protein [Opitutaceae bacterium]MBP9914401.1 hypothetical protein [Opitutaceae bacterium]